MTHLDLIPRSQSHWDGIYARTASDAVSWYRPHLETSLRFIEKIASPADRIIDVGGGRSTLVDDLLDRGFRDVTVLDLSAVALEQTRQRLNAKIGKVHWEATDILTAELPRAGFDLWHDRAVFHFLTRPEQRDAYVSQAANAIASAGWLLIAVFGPEGPLKCSGLDVCRYDAASLARTLEPRFALSNSCLDSHQTPFGTVQQFQVCLFRRL